jgi:hypothetical protein
LRIDKGDDLTESSCNCVVFCFQAAAGISEKLIGLTASDELVSTTSTQIVYKIKSWNT